MNSQDMTICRPASIDVPAVAVCPVEIIITDVVLLITKET